MIIRRNSYHRRTHTHMHNTVSHHVWGIVACRQVLRHGMWTLSFIWKSNFLYINNINISSLCLCSQLSFTNFYRYPSISHGSTQQTPTSPNIPPSVCSDACTRDQDQFSLIKLSYVNKVHIFRNTMVRQQIILGCSAEQAMDKICCIVHYLVTMIWRRCQYSIEVADSNGVHGCLLGREWTEIVADIHHSGYWKRFMPCTLQLVCLGNFWCEYVCNLDNRPFALLDADAYLCEICDECVKYQYLSIYTYALYRCVYITFLNN